MKKGNACPEQPSGSCQAGLFTLHFKCFAEQTTLIIHRRKQAETCQAQRAGARAELELEARLIPCPGLWSPGQAASKICLGSQLGN